MNKRRSVFRINLFIGYSDNELLLQQQLTKHWFTLFRTSTFSYHRIRFAVGMWYTCISSYSIAILFKLEVAILLGKMSFLFFFIRPQQWTMSANILTYTLTNTLLYTSDVPHHVRSTIYESMSTLNVCTKHSRYIDLLVNCWTERSSTVTGNTSVCNNSSELDDMNNSFNLLFRYNTQFLLGLAGCLWTGNVPRNATRQELDRWVKRSTEKTPFSNVVLYT